MIARVRSASGETLNLLDRTEEIRPRVSPDGTVVVFESVLKDRFRLFVRRMDGTGNRLLFADGDGTHAVW